MKKFLKYITIVALVGGLFTSCETLELDGRVSPNDLAADQADPNLLLNSIQLAYVSNMDVLSDLGAELTRIDYMFGRDYFNNYPGSTLDGVWSRTYSSGFNDPGAGVNVGIFSNVLSLQQIDAASDTDFSFHIAVGQTLKAHMLLLLVDYIGEATLSQAGDPAQFPAPELDSGADVYAGALALLSEAETLFSSSPATQGATDLFYGGNTGKWIKLINSLRLKAYATTGNASAFDAVIANNNFISSAADDFQFQYGTSELQPDNRHPDYATDYTPSGANIYQSNWLMEYMLDNNDPRIRYYFYRQQNATPGADAAPNEETLACSLVPPPPHYINGGFTYCSVPQGYWGRSHGNDEGTPPDNFTRTAVGVYPAGGRFDDDSFGSVGLGLGGGGAGIEPIILSSYIDFWRAEVATSDADKASFLRAGIEKSIAKVQEFSALDSSADQSLAPSNSDINDFVDTVVMAFQDAETEDDKQNVLAQQYWVALFGGATEAYNYYRRTGYPTTLLPNWEPDPGVFPRSFLYPQNEVITNPSLTQKTTLSEQVFWDTNPAGPAFPRSN